MPRTVSRRAVAGTALAALLLSACATVPDSGAVQPGKDAGPGQQYLLQPVIVGPGPNWTPSQVTSGFLEAITSYAHDYAVAKQYLATTNCGPTKWEPHPSWAVTVTREVSLRQARAAAQVQPGASGAENPAVLVSADQIASVNYEGQYQAIQPQPQPWEWTAALKRCGGTWRITDPPKGPPPLYVSNFQRVYLPRSLYFLASSNLVSVHQALVPDPIFVPLQATSVEVAQTLVSSLLRNPQDWLNSAAVTALAGARLVGKVTINAGTATVNLDGSAGLSRPAVLSQILAQLVSTLASPSYGQPAIAQSVQLKINGRAQPLVSWSGGQPELNHQALLTVPEPAQGQPLYTLAAHNVVQRRSGPSLTTVTKFPVQAGAALTSIAVSPGGQYVAGITRSGNAIYYGLLRPGAKLTKWTHHGPFTSLSWDSNGNLWVVGANYVEMLHPNRPSVPLGGLPNGTIVQMQVAPDGVRAALVVNGPNGNQLMMCALDYASAGPGNGVTGAALGPPVVIGADVSDPDQLTWYDPNDLVVLAQLPSDPVLREVPVNGDSSTGLNPAPGIQSVTSAGPSNPLAAGLTQGGLALSQTLNGSPDIRKNAGQSPTYPAPSGN